MFLEVRAKTNGSNPAHGDAKRKGAATQCAEVFALLWELSNGWIGLLLGFHCLGRLGKFFSVFSLAASYLGYAVRC